MSVTIKKGKTSLTAVIDNIEKSRSEHVAIGLYSKGAGKDYDKNLAMRMAHLELGSAKAHLPPRPVFSTTLESRKGEMKKLIADLWAGVLAGKISRKNAYREIGKVYEKMLKDQFTRRRFMSLSPNYKVRPSGKLATPGSIPLLDTKTMRDKIEYKVEM